MASTGVALLQMGGPRSPSEVAPFLVRLFRDPDIIQLPRGLRPLQPALGWAMGKGRAPSVRRKYAEIAAPRPWLPEDQVARNPGASPICAVTERLAAAVEKELANRGAWSPVAACFRYVEPSAPAALGALRRAGAGEVLAVSLYPHWSTSTTGSSLNDLRRAAAAAGVPVRAVERWGLHPGYLDLAAADAQAALDRVPAEHRGRVHLVFSAHGLPKGYVARGDPYADEVRATAEALAARLSGFDSWALTFQSRVGPVEWLRPYTDEHLREGGKDWSAVVLVPLGFVGDHIETLYDADVLAPAVAREAGVAFYTRARTFNDRPEFARVVADLVQGAA